MVHMFIRPNQRVPQMNDIFNIDIHNLNLPLEYHETYDVMNIEWDYNYYQPWSDNEWLVDEMLAMLDEDIIMQ